MSDAALYAALLLATVVVVVWGAVLTALRVGGVPVPVGLAVALLVVPIVRTGGRLWPRRLGAAVPALLWVGIAVALGSRTPEGDLVLVGGIGLGFLAISALGAAGAVSSWRPATPRGPGRRHTPGGADPAG